MTNIRRLVNGSVYFLLFVGPLYSSAADLERLPKGPMTADVEMGMSAQASVIGRIQQIPGYISEFEQAFGRRDAVSIANAVSAIAAFERTLVTPGSNLGIRSTSHEP